MDIRNVFNQLVFKYNGQYCSVLHPPTSKECFDLAVAFTDMLGVPNYPNNPSPFPYNNAYQIYTDYGNFQQKYFDRIENTPDYIPQVGDIVVFSGNYNGGPGHVVIASGTGNTQSFKAFSQNDPTGSRCIIRFYNYDYVLGCLRFKGQGTSTSIETPIDSLVTLKQHLNGKLQDASLIKYYTDDLTRLVDDLISFKKEVNEKNKVITEKDKTIKKMAEDLALALKELSDKEKAFAKSMDHTVSKHMEELLVQEAKYKGVTEELKKCQIKKASWVSDLLDIIKEKWGTK